MFQSVQYLIPECFIPGEPEFSFRNIQLIHKSIKGNRTAVDPSLFPACTQDSCFYKPVCLGLLHQMDSIHSYLPGCFQSA